MAITSRKSGLQTRESSLGLRTEMVWLGETGGGIAESKTQVLVANRCFQQMGQCTTGTATAARFPNMGVNTLEDNTGI